MSNPSAQEPTSPPAAAAQEPAGPAQAAAAPVAEQPENAPPQASAAPPVDPELERLRTELATTRKRVDELARAYQAVNSDKEDFKARLTRERERMIDVERGNVAISLIEAIDELDRCLTVGDESPLAKGVKLIRDGLLAKLLGTGIERLSLVGKTYDPNVAEATDMEITASPDDDQKIVAEINAGYRMKDRTLRPARVKVAKYVKPADA